MKAVCEGKYLRGVFEAVGKIVNTAILKASEDGMKLRAMNSEHTILVDMELEKSLFEDYEIEEDESIGIDISQLLKILKRAKKDDNITLETSKETIKITIDGTAERTFEFPALADVEEDEIKFPELNYEAEISIEDPSVLKEIMKDVEIVGNAAVLKATKEEFIIQAQGNGYAFSSYKAAPSNISLNLDEEAEEVKSAFSVELLKDVLRADKFIYNAKVHLGNDIPLKLEYTGPGIKLTYLIAPRIENE